MAKRVDPFDKFREATLGSSSSLSLSDALTTKKPSQAEQAPAAEPEPAPAAPVVEPQPAVAAKISKNADRELVSFHISKDTKKKMNLLKIDLEKPLGDLYNEAIEDLLVKYGRS